MPDGEKYDVCIHTSPKELRELADFLEGSDHTIPHTNLSSGNDSITIQWVPEECDGREEGAPQAQDLLKQKVKLGIKRTPRDICEVCEHLKNGLACVAGRKKFTRDHVGEISKCSAFRPLLKDPAEDVPSNLGICMECIHLRRRGKYLFCNIYTPSGMTYEQRLVDVRLQCDDYSKGPES